MPITNVYRKMDEFDIFETVANIDSTSGLVSITLNQTWGSYSTTVALSPEELAGIHMAVQGYLELQDHREWQRNNG